MIGKRKNMKTTVQQSSRPATVERTTEFVAPEVNIFETKDGYSLEAEMPGVNKQGLEVTLEGNEITIVGHRQVEPLTGQAVFRESREADFRRVFELDPAIDTSRISARMEQGILCLTLPKSEKVKPRKISVD
jgi:HSP20 family protein